MPRLGLRRSVAPPICYCSECGRLLRPSERGQVVAYRRRIGRMIAVMALACMAAGLVWGAVVTLLTLRATGVWKP